MFRILLPAVALVATASAQSVPNPRQPTDAAAAGAAIPTCQQKANGLVRDQCVTAQSVYQSQQGYLGCYLDFNKVAYFPQPSGNSAQNGCTDVCLKITNPATGLSSPLLNIGQSTGPGTYDISYDLWNYLATGHHASEAGKAVSPGATPMKVEKADELYCDGLFKKVNGKIAVLAENGPSCGASDWLTPDKYARLNFADQECKNGYKDEVCTGTPGTPSDCPHPAGGQPASGMAIQQIPVAKKRELGFEA